MKPVLWPTRNTRTRAYFVTPIALLFAFVARAGTVPTTRATLDSLIDSRVISWRFSLGEHPGAEKSEFDDHDWQPVELGFVWWPHDSVGWFRTRITIPEIVCGVPVSGSPVRLRLDVDNGATPFVNGVAQGEFTWDKGDVLLTEHAHPGEVVTVALHAVNGPGYGQLLDAHLTTEVFGNIGDDLKTLLAQFDSALGDVEYVPNSEAQHWHTLVDQAMQALDLNAYRSGNADRFAQSIRHAREILLSDTKLVTAQLDQTTQDLATLKSLMDEARKRGYDEAYRELDARVVESFSQYARDDIADPSIEYKIRGIKAAQYVATLSKTAIEAITQQLKDNKASAAIPRYRTAPVNIHNGAFFQDERPIFFTGVGHFGQVRQDTPILTQYGLNIIQIEMGPSSVLPSPDTVNTDAVRGIVNALDTAAAHNVMVNLLISIHYFPEWALEKNPNLSECGMGFIKYCVDAPKSRAVLQHFIDVLMPAIAHHPALHSICLSNEPEYKGRCEYSRTAFHEWLRTRHHTIDAVNAAYGTTFAGIDDVPIPDDSSNYALYFDWCCFNQDRFLEFHQFLRDQIHRYDPVVPVHAKVMSKAFEDPGNFEAGINFEAFPLIGTIAGNDCAQGFVTDKRGEYQQEWLNMAMNYTLQQSLAPEAPIFNSEDHVIADGDKHYIPACHIRTAYWMQALHGQGAATTWVWERGQSGDFAENILTRPCCVHALGRIALDLDRLAPKIVALQRAKADAAIFYSHASLLPSRDHVEEAKAAYEGSYFTDATFNFVTESQATDGKLASYKLVVVPNATNVPQSTFDAFQHYLDSGGPVITIGDCFINDEYGHSRNATLKAADKVHLLAYPSPLTARAYREVLDQALDTTHCERLARLEGPHGKPVWGVNLRATLSDGKLLVSLVNLARESQTVSFRKPYSTSTARDLLADSPVTFPLTLTPLEPVLLELEPKS